MRQLITKLIILIKIIPNCIKRKKKLFFHKKVKSGRQVLKSPQNPLFFKYSLTRINFKRVESFEPTWSTDELSSVQKLGVPVFLYNNSCTWFIKIIEGEGIGFYLQPTQPLLDSRSNPNHIQPMLMHMIASVVQHCLPSKPTDLRTDQKLSVGYFHRTDRSFLAWPKVNRPNSPGLKPTDL